jgi:putative methionine-R-sulfoxide reductase with GAF domain
MELIAKRLHEKVTRYNWTGFYLIDPADPGSGRRTLRGQLHA